MELYQMKLAGFSCPAIKTYIIEKIFKKNNIKYQISNSNKSIYFEEQIIYHTDQLMLYNIARNIIESNEDLVLCNDCGILTIKPKFLVKLIIEHDIYLDVYDDNEKEDVDELSTFFKSISLYHSIDEKLIFKIHAQKCYLEFEYINEILKHINCGSKKESYLTMYEGYKYAITQIQGYQKYLAQ